MNKNEIIPRFWSKVAVKGINQCWIWQGAKSKSTDKIFYGQFRVGKNIMPAHIVSWLLSYDVDIKNLLVLHKCDNSLCVNPNHLFLGTHQDNMDDMVRKNRQAKGKQSGSHLHPEKVPRGENHKNAKLTENDVIDIRYLYENKIMNQPELARKYGLRPASISLIISRKNWKHVS